MHDPDATDPRLPAVKPARFLPPDPIQRTPVVRRVEPPAIHIHVTWQAVVVSLVVFVVLIWLVWHGVVQMIDP